MNTRGYFLQTVKDVDRIYAQWEEGAAMDAGFDGGEFSGPACSRAAELEAHNLCDRRGFDLDNVLGELHASSCRAQEEFDELVDSMAGSHYSQGRAGYGHDWEEH